MAMTGKAFNFVALERLAWTFHGAISAGGEPIADLREYTFFELGALGNCWHSAPA